MRYILRNIITTMAQDFCLIEDNDFYFSIASPSFYSKTNLSRLKIFCISQDANVISSRITWYCNLNVVYEPFTINLKLVMKNWFIIVVMLSKKMQAILFNVRKKIKSHGMRYVIHINIYFIFYSWCHSKWLIIVEARPKFHVIVNICSTFL